MALVDGTFVFIFNCPLHGDEIEFFCFRAFEASNRKNWRKAKISFESIEASDAGIDEFIRNLLPPYQTGYW